MAKLTADKLREIREQKKKADEAYKLARRLASQENRTEQYEAHKAAMAERSRKQSAAGREIGKLPAIKHPEAREQSRLSLRYHCEHYHPQAFSLAWSDDHLRVMQKIQDAVLTGGLFAMAMPRGSGKTTLCIAAAEWAILHGHRRYVVLIGAEAESAKKNIAAIRIELETNELLRQDFPEACIPLYEMAGVHQRKLTYQGEPIRMQAGSTDLMLAHIPGAPCSQARVECIGITGHVRGRSFRDPTGEIRRPDLVIVDDPQTDESARSLADCNTRETILMGAVLGLAGPGKKIAGVMPCTVIRPGDLADRILDPERAPIWQGERCKMVYEWPRREDLWARYAELRIDGLKAGRGIADATEFYAANRDEMDAGSRVAWPARFDADELSAIQNAYNLRLRNEEVFFAEYQNEPRSAVAGMSDAELTADQIAAKVNRLPHLIAPLAAERMVAFIDVQQQLLYYTLCAFGSDFSGWVIDYGAWPDQRENYFTLTEARHTIEAEFPGQGLEARIHGALDRLVQHLTRGPIARQDGATLPLERIVIDANWGQSTDVVYSYCSTSPICLPSHGRYVGARSAAFAEYKRKPGDRVGHNWRMPNVQGRRATRYVLFDANYWKSFVQARLAVGLGGVGSLSLFGDDPQRHRMIAEHLSSEYRTRTAGNGRELDEWQMRPGRQDNHLLDCLVGAHVAASIQGCQLPGTAPERETSSGRRKAPVPAHMRRA